MNFKPFQKYISVAYQALELIGEFYNADTELKKLSAKERLQQRKREIKPKVEAFFAWVREQVRGCSVPPNSATGKGLAYVLNQEKYLKVFLQDGNVPIDNSASERAIRTFCLCFLSYKKPPCRYFHLLYTTEH